MSWSFSIAFTEESVTNLLASVDSMAGDLPAATVGFVPTVFDGWDVGLVCNVLCLLVFFVCFIYAGRPRFGS
jgi:hypothetical protein